MGHRKQTLGRDIASEPLLPVIRRNIASEPFVRDVRTVYSSQTTYFCVRTVYSSRTTHLLCSEVCDVLNDSMLEVDIIATSDTVKYSL